jgi:hypothetical protein
VVAVLFFFEEPFFDFFDEPFVDCLEELAEPFVDVAVEPFVDCLEAEVDFLVLCFEEPELFEDDDDFVVSVLVCDELFCFFWEAESRGVSSRREDSRMIRNLCTAAKFYQRVVREISGLSAGYRSWGIAANRGVTCPD